MFKLTCVLTGICNLKWSLSKVWAWPKDDLLSLYQSSRRSSNSNLLRQINLTNQKPELELWGISGCFNSLVSLVKTSVLKHFHNHFHVKIKESIKNMPLPLLFYIDKFLAFDSIFLSMHTFCLYALWRNPSGNVIEPHTKWPTRLTCYQFMTFNDISFSPHTDH